MLTRKLKFSYVFALALIALLTLVNTKLQSALLAEHRETVASIEKSALQRMRVQKISSAVLHRSLASRPADAELERLVKAFASDHRRLSQKFVGAGLDETAASDLDRLYFGDSYSLDAAASDFLRRADEAVAGGDAKIPQALADQVFSAASAVVPKFDSAVNIYQQAGDRQIERMERLDVLFLLIIFITLTAEALFVFQPLIRRINASFDGIFQNAAVGIASADLDGRLLHFNDKFCAICGLSQSELAGKTVAELVHVEDREKDAGQIKRLLNSELTFYSVEKRLPVKSGKTVWIDLTVSAVRDLAGSPQRLALVFRDITERKRLETTRDVLLGEVAHRVKNNLAVVQGVIGQILATNPDPATFSKAVSSRIQSIGRAHDLLAETDWKPLKLSEVVEFKKSGPFAGYQHRIAFQGDDIELPSQTTVVVNMLLFELLTNAMKHGALSNDSGIVTISSVVASDDDRQTVSMRWTEQGGPEVMPPRAKGFGSFMIQRGVEFSLNGAAKIDFEKSGLNVEISFPILKPAEASGRFLASRH